MLFPDPVSEEEAKDGGEDEAPLVRVLPPLIAMTGNGEGTPAAADWDPGTIFWWRLFVEHGLVRVDARMQEDPARWHLEGLNPQYEDAEEAQMVEVLEELKLGD